MVKVCFAQEVLGSTPNYLSFAFSFCNNNKIENIKIEVLGVRTRLLQEKTKGLPHWANMKFLL
jgi:hypothetical protein